jgi:hypothetical protein
VEHRRRLLLLAAGAPEERAGTRATPGDLKPCGSSVWLRKETVYEHRPHMSDDGLVVDVGASLSRGKKNPPIR